MHTSGTSKIASSTGPHLPGSPDSKHDNSITTFFSCHQLKSVNKNLGGESCRMLFQSKLSSQVWCLPRKWTKWLISLAPPRSHSQSVDIREEGPPSRSRFWLLLHWSRPPPRPPPPPPPPPHPHPGEDQSCSWWNIPVVGLWMQMHLR